MGTYNVVTEILHNSDVPVWAFEILSLKFSTLLSAVKKIQHSNVCFDQNPLITSYYNLVPSRNKERGP